MINKNAIGKRSTDPIQEKLRENKSHFNQNCSATISRLIAFKKGLNGRGDARLGLPPSNIKDPLPNEIPSLLNELATEFQKLVSDASSIIQEQESYSKNRKKPQPKTAATIKQASNSFSRGITYLGSLFTNKNKNRFRVNLLKLFVELEKKLKDLENIILVLDIQNIPKAIKKYQIIKDELEIIKSLVNQASKQLEPTINSKNNSKSEQTTTNENQEEPQKEPQEPITSEPKTEQQQQTSSSEENKIISSIAKDLLYAIDLDIKNDDLLKIRKLLNQYEKSGGSKKELIFARIEEEYKNFISELNSSLSKKDNFPPVKSLEEARDLLQKMQSNAEASYLIQKTSANALTRLLKRTLLKTINRDPTSEIRLQTSETIELLIKKIDKIMNGLEKGFDLNNLNNDIAELLAGMKEIDPNFSILNSMYKNYYILNDDGKKKTDNYTNVLNKNIRRDIENEFF